MPIEKITEFMNSMNCLDQVEMLLAIHCAPLLHGIKLSNLVKMNKEQSEVLCKNIRGAGLSIWFLLYEGDGNQVLLFRRDEMQEFLNRSDIQRFLKRFGYTDFNLTKVLLKLSVHMKAYKNEQQDFPHELGILLGYPIDDVLAYMENKGENYKYCGYWKVYHNIEQAKRQFEAFNEVRDCAIARVLSGSSFFKQDSGNLRRNAI